MAGQDIRAKPAFCQDHALTPWPQIAARDHVLQWLDWKSRLASEVLSQQPRLGSEAAWHSNFAYCFDEVEVSEHRRSVDPLAVTT